MYLAIRRAARTNRLWIAVAAAIAVLAFTLVAAHSGVAGDHMGKAAAICLAVASVAAATVASGPRLNRLVPSPIRAASDSLPRIAEPPSLPRDGRARGHPAVLQVLRR